MLLPVLCFAAVEFGMISTAILIEVLAARWSQSRQQRIFDRRHRRKESVSHEELEFAYREIPTTWDIVRYRVPWLLLSTALGFLYFPGGPIIVITFTPSAGVFVVIIIGWILAACGAILALKRAYEPIPPRLDKFKFVDIDDDEDC